MQKLNSKNLIYLTQFTSSFPKQKSLSTASPESSFLFLITPNGRDSCCHRVVTEPSELRLWNCLAVTLHLLESGSTGNSHLGKAHCLPSSLHPSAVTASKPGSLERSWSGFWQMATRPSATGKSTQIMSTRLIPEVGYFIFSRQSKICFYKKRHKCPTAAELAGDYRLLKSALLREESPCTGFLCRTTM